MAKKLIRYGNNFFLYSRTADGVEIDNTINAKVPLQERRKLFIKNEVWIKIIQGIQFSFLCPSTQRYLDSILPGLDNYLNTAIIAVLENEGTLLS